MAQRGPKTLVWSLPAAGQAARRGAAQRAPHAPRAGAQWASDRPARARGAATHRIEDAEGEGAEDAGGFGGGELEQGEVAARPLVVAARHGLPLHPLGQVEALELLVHLVRIWVVIRSPGQGRSLRHTRSPPVSRREQTRQQSAQTIGGRNSTHED